MVFQSWCDRVDMESAQNNNFEKMRLISEKHLKWIYNSLQNILKQGQEKNIHIDQLNANFAKNSEDKKVKFLTPKLNEDRESTFIDNSSPQNNGFGKQKPVAEKSNDGWSQMPGPNDFSPLPLVNNESDEKQSQLSQKDPQPFLKNTQNDPSGNSIPRTLISGNLKEGESMRVNSGEISDSDQEDNYENSPFSTQSISPANDSEKEIRPLLAPKSYLKTVYKMKNDWSIPRKSIVRPNNYSSKINNENPLGIIYPSPQKPPLSLKKDSSSSTSKSQRKVPKLSMNPSITKTNPIKPQKIIYPSQQNPPLKLEKEDQSSTSVQGTKPLKLKKPPTIHPKLTNPPGARPEINENEMEIDSEQTIYPPKTKPPVSINNIPPKSALPPKITAGISVQKSVLPTISTNNDSTIKKIGSGNNLNFPKNGQKEKKNSSKTIKAVKASKIEVEKKGKEEKKKEKSQQRYGDNSKKGSVFQTGIVKKSKPSRKHPVVVSLKKNLPTHWDIPKKKGNTSMDEIISRGNKRTFDKFQNVEENDLPPIPPKKIFKKNNINESSRGKKRSFEDVNDESPTSLTKKARKTIGSKSTGVKRKYDETGIKGGVSPVKKRSVEKVISEKRGKKRILTHAESSDDELLAPPKKLSKN